ncbi:MAG: S-layer homology domain-containing protein [Candidatus Altimarinota bacterium]
MKKLLLFAAAALLILSPFKHALSLSNGGPGVTGAAAATFPDVKSPILLEAVNYLNEQGIIKGYPDGTFKPDQVINRAEALKIIFESRGIAVDEDSNSGFPDVDSSLWFAKYVTSAKRLGLINGYADGTYKPTQFVNKAEFMKIAMLAQSYYSELPTANSELPFTDLDPSAWYIPYLSFALSNEFVDRVSKFNPTAGMTRGEAALIIYRVAKYNEGLVEKQPEPLPVLSCETCVNGVDLSQYEWIVNSPVVRIEAGKLWISNQDFSVSVKREGTTVNLTANAMASLKETITYDEFGYETDNTSPEEKRKIDVNYPEYYARILGINGGAQVGDSYNEGLKRGSSETYTYKDKDGNDLTQECCKFELQVINTYNGKDFPPFEEWRTSDAGKERLYDVIRQDIYRIQQE